MPAFPSVVREPIVNHLNGARCLLVRADQVEASAGHLAEIVGIANEPVIYDWLFRAGLEGAPYPVEKAGDFLRWSADGWNEGTHFVFLVVGEDGKICAACDIKSADFEGAEIGYWSSSRHRGVMTNAVRAMCALAKSAGYRSLTARARLGNLRSQAVLGRLGFTELPAMPNDTHYSYCLKL